MEVMEAKSQLQEKDPCQCVRVAVNIRPLITPELINGCTDCIAVVPGESQVQIGSHAFTFDYVYGNGGLTYSRIFENCVQPLVDSLFHGYNATVLAYGQTGSGKTYTMGTNYAGSDSENGIIPRVMESIFSKIDASKDTTEVLIRVSFIEIFKEEVFDLLDSNSTQSKNEFAVQAKTAVLSRVPIQIRETMNGGITLFGVTEAEVRTRAEMVSYLLRGSLSRATASTNMNSQSSRSHAIFTISLEQKNTSQSAHGATNNTLNDDILSAKLHLVDLAGSERAKRTGADGKRLREGIHINKGLLSLGNVISALGDEKKRKEGGHVPYRDSKLTRLLQDSLGGNSKTIMIACVSPADSNAEETLNTLKYANRARNIQNKAIINRDPIAAQTQKMRNQIEQLQAELLYLRGDAGLPFEELQILRKKVSLLEGGNARLQRDLNEHIPFYESLVQCTLSARVEKVKILSQLESAQDGKSVDEDHSTLNEFLDSVRSYVEKNQDMERKLLKFHKPSSTKSSRLNDVPNLENHEIMERNGRFTCPEDYSHVYETKPLNFVESGDNGDNGDNGGEEKEREHASLQEKLDNELRELDKMLQQKEAEMNQFTIVNTTVIKQHYEKKILELEHEKKFLQREIEESHNNLASISSVSDDGAQKLKAEYLQKLNFLESQVSDLKKRQDSQSHLLRQKQKSDDAAKRLQDEIQRIKSQKVQLQHKIKQESEQFRLWKASREKEVMQLKKEGRRNEYEMHKLLALNQRQKMVLQRKTEEAAMATRRLKDLLESRKASSREASATGNNQAIVQAIEHELEVTARVYEVRSEYDHQMEERAKMAKEVANLKEEMHFFKRNQNLNSSPDSLSPGARNSRIFALESMLSTSSGILVSMASQLSEAEGRERVFTGKGRWNQVRSLPDAKDLLNHLFDMSASMRCQLWDQQVLCREKDSEIRELKEKVVQVNNRIEIHAENLKDLYPVDGHNYQLRKDRCSVILNGKGETVQDDMDMSESEASDEDWVATDTDPDTDIAPRKNLNHKSTRRPTIIPSETQGQMLCLTASASASAPDPCLHCTCGRASRCKTYKCKCRSSGAACGTSCGCLSKKCMNRVDTIDEGEVKRGSELHQNLASEGAMLLQSAFTDKTEDGSDSRRRMPLSDIGNTMKKFRPNRRRKVWKKSSIKLVQVPAVSGPEKRGDDGTGKQEAGVEEEDVGEVKLPRTIRLASMAETSRSLRERNTTEAAAAAASHNGCTEAKENRGSSNV